MGAHGSRRSNSIPTKPRFRSVPDVAVLNSQPFAGLLIKCRRPPRGFFWNRAAPTLVCSRGEVLDAMVGGYKLLRCSGCFMIYKNEDFIASLI